jgi:hypothetical protein
MPPENIPDSEAHGAGLVDIFDRPAHVSMTMPELDYLSRLVAVDYQRMIQDRDHALAYGARGFRGPEEMEFAIRLVHSFNMARTAAALDELEAIETARADMPENAGGTDGDPTAGPILGAP